MIVITQCFLRLIIIDCQKKYTKMRGKVSILINVEFDSEHVYGDNYIKTKIKSCGCKSKLNTN